MGCSHFPSYLRQHKNLDMMKLQGSIATAQNLFGGHRPMFGSVVLPLVGVVLFPSPTIRWSCVAPQLMELDQGTRLEGAMC